MLGAPIHLAVPISHASMESSKVGVISSVKLRRALAAHDNVADSLPVDAFSRARSRGRGHVSGINTPTMLSTHQCHHLWYCEDDRPNNNTGASPDALAMVAVVARKQPRAAKGRISRNFGSHKQQLECRKCYNYTPISLQLASFSQINYFNVIGGSLSHTAKYFEPPVLQGLEPSRTPNYGCIEHCRSTGLAAHPVVHVAAVACNDDTPPALQQLLPWRLGHQLAGAAGAASAVFEASPPCRPLRGRGGRGRYI